MTGDAVSPLLDVQDLHVRFGSKEVVRGVNFSIAHCYAAWRTSDG